MLGHLGLQQLLEYPFYDLLKKTGVVEQGLLHDLLGQPTLVLGHPLLL
jgi:hypothetical protein